MWKKNGSLIAKELMRKRRIISGLLSPVRINPVDVKILSDNNNCADISKVLDAEKNSDIEVKNLKLKYRVSLDECLQKFNVFQQNSTSKSMVLNYVFYDEL